MAVASPREQRHVKFSVCLHSLCPRVSLGLSGVPCWVRVGGRFSVGCVSCAMALWSLPVPGKLGAQRTWVLFKLFLIRPAR
eukprot:829226-Alexandrium_andersonii.AAC.1